MLELMAVSEVCTFENTEVPLVNIFGNRHAFRPLLYFKKYDVLLTTPKPYMYVFLDENKKIHFLGLAMLHILFTLHRYPFKATELIATLTENWVGSYYGSI